MRDADHAAAIEREKIAMMLERTGSLGLYSIAQAIRAGQHWKDGN